MLTSCFAFNAFAFNGEEVKSYVAYDLTGNDYSVLYESGPASWYPRKKLADGKYDTIYAVTFRNRNNVKITNINGENALGYYFVSTAKDNHTTFYASSDGVTTAPVSSGRLVFTSRVYASTNKHTASFKAVGTSGGNSYFKSANGVIAKSDPLKACTWYVLKMAVDLDNDTILYTFTEENPQSSAFPHVISGKSTYLGDTFSNIRLDLDIYEGTPYNSETGAGDFIAFDDFRLTYNTHSSKINALSNNARADTTFDKGIFTAETAGSGIFAIALYKNNEIISLSVAENEEELESVKLNMIIDDLDDTIMKIFRFDSDGTPICINKTLTPKEKEYKVYFNETFDGEINVNGLYTNNSKYVVHSDGRVAVSYNGTKNGTRYGTVPLWYPEDNVIVEADFELPEGQKCFTAQLISVYSGGPHALVHMKPGGITYSTSGSANPFSATTNTIIEKDRKFNIAIKIDVLNKKYDIYYNREYVGTQSSSYISKGGMSFYIPVVLASGTILVDNIRAYSGTEFIDIGSEQGNVHYHDFKDYEPSDIYERPEFYELAKAAYQTGHPRVILNSQKVNEIKNSKDETIVSIRNSVLNKADAYVDAPSYSYTYSNTGSIGNVDDALNMMMHLGLAYLLTGDTKYSDRAYKEAEVLFYVPSKDYWGNTGADRDFWNSYSYLDVSEISTIMAICYDWMNDAWTPEQKAGLEKHTFEKGIMRSYNGVFDLYNPNYKGDSQPTFKQTNNWGAVCNGGIMMAAIAFMEADPYICSQLAEANIRALDKYFLPNYAPSGAWSEGTGYWAYALKYLTMMCATLESIAGTDYGIHKTTGLEHSQLYALSCEGKVGAATFGDVGGGHVNAPFMFYWADKYKNSQIGGARIYSMEQFDFSYNIYDLIYYNPEYIDDNYVHPLTSFYEGTELVTMASGYDKNDSFVAISGGRGVDTNHDHLDSGGILVDKNGLRVLCDSGAEHYGATGYFATNRYWYYKARPEGHNIFVINPQKLTNGYTQNKETVDEEDVYVDRPVYYHGQSRTAVSEITAYSSDEKTATMDLSAAYARDAESAKRKISLAGNDVVIEDEILVIDDAYLPDYADTLVTSSGENPDNKYVLSDGNLIEWYWHYKDTATAVVNDSTKYGASDYGTAVVNEDGKSVTLTFRDYSYSDGRFIYPGTVKTYTLSFESNSDFEIEIRDAIRNDYDKPTVTSMRKSGSLSNDYHNSKNTLSKIVVKIKNAKGKVTLKTTVK